MTFKRLLAIGFIFGCTTVCWLILGGTLLHRTMSRGNSLGGEVGEVWGPPMTQIHPTAYYLSPNGQQNRKMIRPDESDVEVDLAYERKKKGLLWHRTYLV